MIVIHPVCVWGLHGLHAPSSCRGSYDLLLRGKVVGSIVRNISASGEARGWRAELIEDLPPEQRPEPFTEAEHAFRTFNAAWKWVGGPEVIQDSPGTERS